MDDRRTHDALDALADLFLTGKDESSPRPRPVRLPPTLRRAALITAGAPDHENPDINDPPPTPADVAPDPPRLRLHRTDPGAPAALRAPVADSQAEATPRVASGPRADVEPRIATPPAAGHEAVHVELALLGELPGFAGPWLAQYAYRLALRHGPVAIVRIEPDGIDVDLVAPRPGAEALRDDADDSAEHAGGALDRPPVTYDAEAMQELEAWARDHAAGDLIDLLDTLVNFEGAPVRHWLIRPPALPSEMTLALAHQFSHWTLLTGAHPAAVAGVERLLHQLNHDGAAAPRSVKVMYLGCDRAHARVIAQQVRQATQGLLAVPVRSIGAQQKMGPVSLRSLGSFDQVDELLPAVVEFLTTLAGKGESLDAPGPRHAESEPHLTAPARVASAQHSLNPAPSAPTPATPPVTPPSPLTAEPKARVTQPEQVPPSSFNSAEPPNPVPSRPPSARINPARPNLTAPAPAPGHAPGHAPKPGPSGPAFPNASDSSATPTTPETSPLDLAQFLSLPGSVVLEAHSPKHPRVQLLVDQVGVLHLLSQHDSTTPATSDLRAVLLELFETQVWAVEHRQILALTQRQLRLDPAAVPVLHLFSDDARAAAALAARLGDGVKLHLLQAVQLDDDWAWFHTEIN